MDTGNNQAVHDKQTRDTSREGNGWEDRMQNRNEGGGSIGNKGLMEDYVHNGGEQEDTASFLVESRIGLGVGLGSLSPGSRHKAKRKRSGSNGYGKEEGLHTGFGSGSGTPRQKSLRRADDEQLEVEDQPAQDEIQGGRHDTVSNDSRNHYDVYTHENILVNTTNTATHAAKRETSDSSFEIPPAVEASSSSAVPSSLPLLNDSKTTPTKLLLAIEPEVDLSDDGPLVGSSILEDSDADQLQAHLLEDKFLGINQLERELYRAKRDLRKLQALIQKDANLSVRIPQLRGSLAVAAAAASGSSLNDPQPLALPVGPRPVSSSQLAASLANDTRAIMRRDLRDHVIRMFKSQSSSRSNSSQSNHSASS